MAACARISVSGGTGGGGGGDEGTGGSGTGGRPVHPPSTGNDAVAPPPPSDAAVNCTRELRAVLRDFRSGEKNGQPRHPDFHNSDGRLGLDPGIVSEVIGADSKPIYASGTIGSTSSKENFDQWYRDVDGINLRFEKTIPLTPHASRPGVFVYDNDDFYPLANDEGWGNQYLQHNFAFTTELHLSFAYKGGEVFTFRGDDDLFLFVNGHLVVDLGGVHDALPGTVDMDKRAAELGLSPGQTYRMDLFHAERRCCNSRFHLETTLSCIDNIIVE